MMARPHRLRRTLQRIGVPAHLVDAQTDDRAYIDDDITAITISHGGSDPAPALEPSTCELSTIKETSISSGQPLRVRLTNAAAAAISQHVGSEPPERIQARYYGRIGKQSYTDHPSQPVTTLYAASYTAQLARTRSTYRIPRSTRVNVALGYLSQHPDLPEIVFGAAGKFDLLAEELPEATHRNDYGKLTADIGVLIRHTRAGEVQAWGLDYRREWAANRLTTTYPLTRSQAIAPTTWEQPNEARRNRLRAYWTAEDGSTVTRAHGGTDYAEIEEHDWRYITSVTPSLETRWKALAANASPNLFRVPTLTVDLLYLLGSPNRYHRAQAGHLLALDVGDSVNFSNDWPRRVQGIQVVTGLDEHITPDSWEITLRLVPYALVFGNESPAVPPILWDSARIPWDTETRPWAH